MRFGKRLQFATAALALACGLAQAANAAPALQPLSADDAAHYAAAFAACARGDYIDAEMQTVAIQDRALVGYISYDQLMHPTAHKATFEELSGWLASFRDLPLAQRIFGLALRRKPADASDPPAPALAELAPAARPPAAAQPLSERAREEREAFYDGDLRRALRLAPRAGDRWITGLAAYRLKSYDRALDAFRDLARDSSQDAWARSAAAFWGARAATAMGQAAEALDQLRLAAAAPQTFYGMIAARQLKGARLPLQAEAPARLLLASFAPAAAVDPTRFIASDPRAHRAAALAQIGRLQAAAEELRAGVALARSEAEKAQWTTLALALGAPLAAGAPALDAAAEDYPTPQLAPKNGFTLDRALVYAIVRQESRFNPQAVSGKGAVGLMQLTPEAAARAAGDDKLKADMSPLFDPALNLRVGQDYLSWLMTKAVGYDLLRVIAAYNGGPGLVQRTADQLGAEASDPLLLLESLPPLETRDYVQKVLAGYWTYKTMFGEDAASLDALASGASNVDARLDLAQPPGALAELTGQPRQTTLR